MQQVVELDHEHAEFTDLCRLHPLSHRWQRPELFVETAHIGPLSIDLAGASTLSQGGRAAFGSAAALRLRAQPELSAVARSYYELIERTSILESIDGTVATFAVCDADRQPFALLPRSVIHPRDETPNVRRHSTSNGVGAHGDWLSACRTAARELIERDRVLRSWYGSITPIAVDVAGHPVAIALADDYEFTAHSFGHVDVTLQCGRPQERVEVTGVFGFPRARHAPLVYGFGTGTSCSAALDRAWRECIQRLGFLWGEEIPSEQPAFAPTAEYHQEHYLYEAHHDALRAWLAGAHRRYAGILRAVRCDEPEIVFADLTPAALRGHISVVKALSAEAVPLIFGVGHPWLTDRLPSALGIQPIA
jgi:hypothetical protein